MIGSKNKRAGFTLIELLLVVAIIALLIGILLPALGEARRAATLARCVAQIRSLGTATVSYAGENKDRLPNYSWQGGGKYSSKYSDLLGATRDNDAASDQAVDILRRLTGREEFVKQRSWIPYVRYTHLILNDYLSQRLPEKGMACPADKNLLAWQRNPTNPELEGPAPTDATVRARVPYSSSYQLVPANWIPDRGPRTEIYQTNYNGMYFSNEVAGSLAERKLSEVTAPSQKVQFYDSFARHTGQVALWPGYADAKNVVMFYDASVRQLESQKANPGWSNRSTDRLSMLRKAQITFAPTLDSGDPPLRTGQFSSGTTGSDVGGGGGSGPSFTSTAGYYMWTRAGLSGFDVGGVEPSTNSNAYR